MKSRFTEGLESPIPPEVLDVQKAMRLIYEEPEIFEEIAVKAIKIAERYAFGEEVNSPSERRAEAKSIIKHLRGRPDLTEEMLVEVHENKDIIKHRLSDEELDDLTTPS